MDCDTAMNLKVNQELATLTEVLLNEQHSPSDLNIQATLQ